MPPAARLHPVALLILLAAVLVAPASAMEPSMIHGSLLKIEGTEMVTLGRKP